jgi:hypothetical protein
MVVRLPPSIAPLRDVGFCRKVVAGAEVNQIADLVASVRVEQGPRNKVTAVELWSRSKDHSAQAAAARELRAYLSRPSPDG